MAVLLPVAVQAAELPEKPASVETFEQRHERMLSPQQKRAIEKRKEEMENAAAAQAKKKFIIPPLALVGPEY